MAVFFCSKQDCFPKSDTKKINDYEACSVRMPARAFFMSAALRSEM